MSNNLSSEFERLMDIAKSILNYHEIMMEVSFNIQSGIVEGKDIRKREVKNLKEYQKFKDNIEANGLKLLSDYRRMESYRNEVKELSKIHMNYWPSGLILYVQSEETDNAFKGKRVSLIYYDELPYWMIKRFDVSEKIWEVAFHAAYTNSYITNANGGSLEIRQAKELPTEIWIDTTKVEYFDIVSTIDFAEDDLN